MRLALILLFACTSTPDEGPAPAPAEPAAGGSFDGLDRASATHAVPLHVTPGGTYTIAEPSLGDKIDMDEVGRWTLEIEEIPNPKNAPRILKALRAPLPFTLEKQDQRFRPIGMEVYVDGEPLKYSRVTVAKAKNPTWRVNGKFVVLSYPSIPRPGAVEVRWPRVAETLERHDATGEQDLEAFARYSLTLGGETRHGLMLPAPADAAWTLTVPDGGRLDTWLALEKAPLSFPKTNGADAVVLVTEGNAPPEEAGRQKLLPKHSGFEKWTVDLSKWAGREVTVTLRTDPGKNAHPHFDWLFWGSPTVSGASGGAPRRVVVIAFDTMRPDKLGLNGEARDVTPELDAIGRQSVRFVRSWTPAPRTRPSFRSATTGRLPLNAVGATNIAEVFQGAGFATAGIVANIHLQPRFDFDHGYDWWHFKNDEDANVQVDRALDWLNDNAHRDTFLFVHFMDPHMPYRAPTPFADRFVTQAVPDMPKAVPKREEVLRWQASGELEDDWRTRLEEAYVGEIAFMDQELGRFIRGIDALGGDSAVVIHNDHGEEFWEHGGFEHNHTLYDEVTRAMLWFRPGGGLASGVEAKAPASLMDIGPTLFDLAGLEPPDAGVDGASLRPSLSGSDPESWDRPIPVGYLQYSHERWGVVWEDKKYVLHTGSGREELYDLAADPAETTDLAAQTDLAPFVVKLREAHQRSVDAVGPGWRVYVDLRPGDAPIALRLPKAARAAGVMDPEAMREKRANLEWGETPKRTPDDVGAVSLSDDGLSVTFTPGPQPKGMLWVRIDDADPAEAALSALGGPKPLAPDDDGALAWSSGGRSVRVVPGTLIVPPPSEHSLMMALLGAVDEGPSAAEAAQLEALGYIHGDN